MKKFNSSSIILCGFMGSGKSTVGKVFSSKLGRKFVDLDNFIEEKAGQKISEIFSNHGEDYFRKLESDALKEVLSCDKKIVLSLGGGTIVSKINQDIIKNNGILFFIDTPFEICYSRISGDKSRPIASAEDKISLQNRFDTRHKIYTECSDFKISGENSPTEIADEILGITKLL